MPSAVSGKPSGWVLPLTYVELHMIMDINWQQALYYLYQLGIAYVLALPIALEREADARGVGLRTFPLVALAACGYMLTGVAVFDGEQAQSRVIYGIITGIGFIGGGAILKEKGSVTGVATAASIWNTGAIGISVAWEQYDIAIILSLINFITLRGGRFVKERIEPVFRDDAN